MKPTQEFIDDYIRWHGKLDEGQVIGEHWHWCYDWDLLPIDEHCVEYNSCCCYRPEEKLESPIRAREIEFMENFSYGN
jgi:hypothetical protein